MSKGTIETLASMTDAERDKIAEAAQDNGLCVPVALAKVTGLSLSEVFDAFGDYPYARGQWWMFHAKRLGLCVGAPVPIPDLPAARKLPPGSYLIDSVDHLAAVTLPSEKVRGRWQHGEMTAYPVTDAGRSR